MGGEAPVVGGVGEDVQAMPKVEGVRFSVDGEAKGRRGRAGVAVNSRALDELRQRCKLEAVAPVFQASETTGEPRELRRDPNDEVA